MGKCALSCQQGLSNCNGTCVNLQTDSYHCGKCGTKCNAGEVCANGKCSLTCQSGLTNCSGSCVNLTSDAIHCGKCGTKCNAGEVCATGKCAVSCQSGLTNCYGTCVSLQTDIYNCGTCGAKCKSGQICATGKCAVSCQSGLANCSGTCVNLQSDVNNCGKCGAKCKSGEACMAGKCIAVCKSGYTNCSGTCVNLQSDVNNCSKCGTSCPSYTNGSAACKSGVCTVGVCKSGYGNCDNVTSNGCETNLNTNTSHCGQCGDKCVGQSKCSGGKCQAPACSPGSKVISIPFSSTTGWKSSGCCNESNYRVANGNGDVISASFSDPIPQAAVMSSVVVEAGIRHACRTSSKAMEFKLNTTTIGTWNKNNGPHCSCGNSAKAKAQFTTKTGYKKGASNSVSIKHNDSGNCHEAITTVPGTATGTAFRITISYYCP